MEIWMHVAWSNYKGFCTNKAGTELLFDVIGF